MKRIANLGQLFFQLLEILDNSIMYADDIFIITGMGMCILCGRLSVSRPASVPDTAVSPDSIAIVRHLLKHLELALFLEDFRLSVPVPHSNTGGVIAPIFQF